MQGKDRPNIFKATLEALLLQSTQKYLFLFRINLGKQMVLQVWNKNCLYTVLIGWLCLENKSYVFFKPFSFPTIHKHRNIHAMFTNAKERTESAWSRGGEAKQTAEPVFSSHLSFNYKARKEAGLHTATEGHVVNSLFILISHCHPCCSLWLHKQILYIPCQADCFSYQLFGLIPPRKIRQHSRGLYLELAQEIY